MDEEQVDEILGERAYSGGEIPPDVFIDVEKSVEKPYSKNQYQFFFTGEKASARSDGFYSFVQETFPDTELEIEEKIEEDWNEEWRKHYSVIEVSENIRIVPEWKKEEEKGSPGNIYIYPGQGFGTGGHETTYLCLKFFDQVFNSINNESSVLDFGCGSGILGIAAIKLTKCTVDFMDIDEQALDNCQQNIDVNFEAAFDKSSLILRSNFEPSVEYDLVFANILENVLIDEYPLIEKCVRPGGHLIVSGLLNGQETAIIKKYQQFELVSIERKADWCALRLVKCER